MPYTDEYVTVNLDDLRISARDQKALWMNCPLSMGSSI